MQQNKNMSDSYQNELSNLITNLNQVLRVDFHFAILMGSYATNRFHAESDIDIAIYFIKEPTMDQLTKIQTDISMITSHDCDLISLNRVDPIFARQVIETGRELIVKDRSVWNIWKAQQFSIYPDFKKTRQIIEVNLLNRKKYV